MRAVPLRRGPPHPCSYLPGRIARMAWLDPAWSSIPGVYAELCEQGFRRSGADVYRPHCDDCMACVPVRVPVAAFKPDRSQRRTARRNVDLSVSESGPEYREDHYRLYLRYQRSRHADGLMASLEPGDYLGFLAAAWQETVFIEFRERERLVAVSVADRVEDGLSAVYTFFDPDEPRRGLGTQAVLYLIGRAQALGLRWLYLGYWIRDSAKMDYKRRFRPLEGRVSARWISLGMGQTVPID